MGREKQAHTGVYLGDGWVVDARGTSEGVVKTKIGSYGWTHWAIPVLGGTAAEVVGMEIKYKATVTGGALNLRGEAKTTGTRILQIPSGAEVDVLDVYAPAGWLFVSYAGKTGYVMAQYLVNVEDIPETPKPVEMLTVSADELHSMLQHAAAIEQLGKLWLGVKG